MTAQPYMPAGRCEAHAPSAGRSLLRTALRLDAAVTGANGLAYLAVAGPLSDLLGVPAGALRGIGAFLLLFAAGVAATAAQDSPNTTAVKAIVAANVVWAIDSVVLVALDAWSPTTAGSVWIVMQAGVVALFAALQAAGLRRAG